MNKSAFISLLFILLGIGLLFDYFYKESKEQKLLSQNIPEAIKYTLVKDPTIVAAGDISCDFVSEDPSVCKEKTTATLIKKTNPDAVLALGDVQYANGTYDKFTSFYDKTWGAFKNKTYPVLGNHEYDTGDANGYFAYFAAFSGVHGKGYYSFDLGSWHLLALNSNCWAVGGCEKDSVQWRWVFDDLTKNNKKCTLAFWHHPLFSSGQHGGNIFMKDIWQILRQHHVDLILVGHDHLYERFAKQDENGTKTKDGIRQFTVGTGGRSLYQFTTLLPNSETHDNSAFGILQLVLHKDSYSWEFLSATPSKFHDEGKETCL